MKLRCLGKKPAFLAVCMAILLTYSCSLFSPDDNHDNFSYGSGSSLLRYGSRIYIVGGKDAEGASLATVRSALVEADGSLGEFFAESSLPEGIAYSSVVASDSMVYCIGGEDSAGIPTRDVRYTYIKSDGSLGFGTDRRWESNEVPLPEARSRAAILLHDGWIYLIGGLVSDDGHPPSAGIIRARVYQDGQVGMWYPAGSLPEAASRVAAAILDNRLYVAGGLTTAGVASDDAPVALNSFVSYSLDPYGALGDRRIEPELSDGLFGAVLIPDGEDLVLAGGFNAAGAASDAVYRFSSGAWSGPFAELSIGAVGSSAGRAAGRLFYLPQGFYNDEGAEVCLPAQTSQLGLPPEAPEAVPGSGRVPNNTALRFTPEPGTVVRYEKNGIPVTQASSIYLPDTPPAASSSTNPQVNSISLKAFAADGSFSPEATYDFIPGNVGFFVAVSDRLEANASSAIFPGYIDCTMRESTTDMVNHPDGYIPATSERFRLSVPASGEYFLHIADADTNAQTGKVSFNLVERDFLTEVPDAAGLKLSNLKASANSALRLWLQAGVYYLRAVDDETLAGRSFGLRISRY